MSEDGGYPSALVFASDVLCDDPVTKRCQTKMVTSNSDFIMEYYVMGTLDIGDETV